MRYDRLNDERKGKTMDMTMEQMRANRDALRAEVARRVEAWRAAGGQDSEQFYATGPIWGKDDSLWMIVRERGVRTYDLRVTADGVVSEER